MDRWFRAAGLVFAVSLFVLSPALAASIVRTVVPGENSTYQVVLLMPGEMVAGIVETVPPGYHVEGVDALPGQFRVDGNTIRFVILGERTVQYTLTGKENPEGAIEGSWTDITTGQGGRVLSRGETGEPVMQDTKPAPPVPSRQSGPAPLLTSLGAVVVLLVVAQRFSGRRGFP